MSNQRGPDPGPLMAMATSYWSSQALFAALELDVFARLAGEPMSAGKLAATIGAAPHATRLLLNALVGLGLIERDGEDYANGAATGVFLVPGSPAYLGNALGYARDMYAAWAELPAAVRDDAPVVPAASYLGEDPQLTRRFVYGMHARAMGVGQALVEMVDLSGRQRMLDVGGGPGTYSALFTRRYPGLSSQVLELPAVAAMAGEILAGMGAGDHVSLIPGSYDDTPFPEGNDVVLISGVLHREREAGARALLERARDALEPGGLLVVSDVFTDAGGAEPVFAALFGLNMLLSASGGGVHADSDVAGWMTAAGLRNVSLQAFPPPMPHRVVCGTR